MTSRTNDGYCYRERIGSSAGGESVLGYLSRRYRHSSAPEWSERIESGGVRVDDLRVQPSHRLAIGETLSWHRPPWVEPPAPTAFAVLYDDHDLVGVAKPRGLAAMPGGGFYEHTLLRRVARYRAAASPLHRLGRGTSGVTLFAKHRAAKQALTRCWHTVRVTRRYLALVAGRVSWDRRSIDAPIGPVPHAILGSVAAVSDAGKPSLTHARLVERREEASLLEVEIATGRTHQIRIHLAAIGHPLVGEPLYPPGGVPAADVRVLPGETGFWLHAHHLSFPHPTTGAPCTIECHPPPLLRSFES